MTTRWPRVGRSGRRALLGALLAIGVLSSTAITNAGAVTGPAPDPGKKIDPAVSRALDAKDSTDFWISFTAKTDLRQPARQPGWAARGNAVDKALRTTAERSQAATRRELAAEKVRFRPYHIVNAILVRDGDRALARKLAARSEVARILPTRTYELHRPTATDTADDTTAVAWGVTAVNADDVWAGHGVRGEGVVVANIDTGADYTHPALARQYRGNVGGGAYNHNYNWYDPSQVCPSPAPCDNNAHGTHTMGTMAGDDGAGNQIGVAPGARWIAAKGCESDGCSDYALLAAG
ncbi:MAG: S8 family serine peptidase, partial [Micromonosporaceae bacterium]